MQSNRSWDSGNKSEIYNCWWTKKRNSSEIFVSFLPIVDGCGQKAFEAGTISKHALYQKGTKCWEIIYSFSLAFWEYLLTRNLKDGICEIIWYTSTRTLEFSVFVVLLFLGLSCKWSSISLTNMQPIYSSAALVQDCLGVSIVPFLMIKALFQCCYLKGRWECVEKFDSFEIPQ